MNPTLPLIFATLAGLAAGAAPLEFQSTERQSSLVELYTSEGCSSCPPAESWMSRLKDAPGLWTDFVPIAFHVDYWNNLGWRDKWSNKGFSDRQRAYSAAWGSDRIYTPGFVLNGKEWRAWNATKNGPSPSGLKTGALTVKSKDNLAWSVSYTPVSPSAGSYEVHAVLLACGIESDVKSGENAGRHLRHDFAALTFTHQQLTRTNDTYEATITLPAPKAPAQARPALAIWITHPTDLTPLQSTGGWLPSLPLPAGRDSVEP